MNKYNIKVSRDTSKWIKTQPDYIMEYAGEALNYMVDQGETDWDEVAKVDHERILFWCLDYAGVDTLEELKKKADRFCYLYGFYGYRLQSRF